MEYINDVLYCSEVIFSGIKYLKEDHNEKAIAESLPYLNVPEFYKYYQLYEDGDLEYFLSINFATIYELYSTNMFLKIFNEIKIKIYFPKSEYKTKGLEEYLKLYISKLPKDCEDVIHYSIENIYTDEGKEETFLSISLSLFKDDDYDVSDVKHKIAMKFIHELSVYFHTNKISIYTNTKKIYYQCDDESKIDKNNAISIDGVYYKKYFPFDFIIYSSFEFFKSNVHKIPLFLLFSLDTVVDHLIININYLNLEDKYKNEIKPKSELIKKLLKGKKSKTPSDNDIEWSYE